MYLILIMLVLVIIFSKYNNNDNDNFFKQRDKYLDNKYKNIDNFKL